jgi:hypothetical protein
MPAEYEGERTRNATCERWMGADGTVHENVVMGIDTPECDISPEDLEKWIDRFPIAPHKPGWHILTLPSPRRIADDL